MMDGSPLLAKVLMISGLVLTLSCNYETRKREQQIQRIRNERVELQKTYPIPNTAKRLMLQFSVPSGDHQEKEGILSSPIHILDADEKNLYVSDIGAHSIFVVQNARIIRQIGRYGQGPGEYDQPSYVLRGASRRLAVLDMGNQRVQWIDEAGHYEGGFRVFRPCFSMGVDYRDEVYLNLAYENAAAPLLDVFDAMGSKIRQIGKRLVAGSPLFNNVDICITGEFIYVAWRMFPVIRKYTLAGELIFEQSFDYGPARQFGEFNRAAIARKGIIRLREVVSKIQGFPDACYVLITYPRLSILKFDEGGNLKDVYCRDVEEDYIAPDFIVRRERGEETFVLLEERPKPSIQTYRSDFPDKSDMRFPKLP
jgi:hypothetical protein